MKIVLVLGGLAVILVLCLAAAVKAAKAEAKRAGELDREAKEAQAALGRVAEFNKGKEEAQKNADEKKKTLRTGDNDTDFANSVSLLHKAAGRRD
jgi:hypothetical protein